MGRKLFNVIAFTVGLVLLSFGFVADFQVFEVNGMAYAAVVEPHCADGDCSDYALWCTAQGRIAMCLDADTDHEVTVCIGAKAMPQLFNNRPNTCIGTCAYAEICNFELLQY